MVKNPHFIKNHADLHFVFMKFSHRVRVSEMANQLAHTKTLLCLVQLTPTSPELSYKSEFMK